MINEMGEDILPHSEWLRIYEEVLECVKAEQKALGKGDCFWGAKVSSRHLLHACGACLIAYNSS